VKKSRFTEEQISFALAVLIAGSALGLAVR
jgi:hypothetical protein